MERQPDPDDVRGAADRPFVPSYETRAPPHRRSRGGGHRSGKLVVLGMILLGILLGVFGLQCRLFMPRANPATQPASGPSFSSPSSQPG